MFKKIAIILGIVATEADRLSEERNGRPLYKTPSAITGALSAVLEGVGIAVGYPGVGSAIGVLLGAFIGHKTEKNAKPASEK